MSHRVETEIVIGASAETVWNIISDLNSYSEWNPFITNAEGEPVIGSKLRITIAPEGSRSMSFSSKVVEAEENRKLAWLGQLGVSGIFDGRHQFEIVPLSETSVRFVHSEEFSGGLAQVIAGRVINQYHPWFIAMNEALKSRSEGRGNK